MPSGFGTFDGLTEWGPFEWPLSFEENTIYLYIRTDVANFGSSLGPTFTPCPSVSNGSVKVIPTSGVKGIKLLSTFADPQFNLAPTGVIIDGIFQYLPLQGSYYITFDANNIATWTPTEIGYASPKAAWNDWIIGRFSYGSGTYDPRGGPPQYAMPQGSPKADSVPGASGTDGHGTYINARLTLAHVPVQSASGAAVEREYLYAIPAGNHSSLFTIAIDGVDPYSIQFAGGEDAGGALGQVVVSVSVYSRIKGKITKLSQLVNYGSDTSQKPTPDDSRTYGVDGANTPGQAVNPLSSFKVGIELDKAVTQKDNFGKKYHPYKITFTPTDANSRDRPPPNPAPPLR